jgi:lipopolysaccharide transport system ATP-binding protein
MDLYERDLFSVQQAATTFPVMLPEKSATETTGADLLSIYLKDRAGQLVEPVSGEPLYICARCRVWQPIAELSLFIAIYQPARDNSLVLHLSSAYDQDRFAVESGDYELRVYLPYLGLLPGSYTLNIYLKDGSLYMLDIHESVQFTVNGQESLNRGQYFQPREWQISDK